MRFSPLFSAVGLTVVVVTRGFAAEAVKFNTNQLVGGDIPKEHRPKYSSEARRQHRTGSGIFILNISEKTGQVQSIQIKKTTGHKILDEACLNALIEWRFKPHTVSKVWLPITFSMSRTP